MPSPGPIEAIEPLLAEPAAAAVLCDLDGTLAPIVERPELAEVPDAARVALARIADRYALTAVVTGRRATVAREIVGLEKLTYVGNHGFELLLPNAPEARAAPELGSRGHLAEEFAAGIDPTELEAVGLRVEDKGPIVALHWRGAADLAGAQDLAARIGAAAVEAGLVLHHGKMVLELRPGDDVDKGTAIESLLLGSEAAVALYAGDDRTDLDAFAGLDRLEASGRLAAAVRVGVASTEGPSEITALADVTVEGPGELIPVLAALAG
jgi:trehalose 6-phosphate phosphatase